MPEVCAGPDGAAVGVVVEVGVTVVWVGWVWVGVVVGVAWAQLDRISAETSTKAIMGAVRRNAFILLLSIVGWY